MNEIKMTVAEMTEVYASLEALSKRKLPGKQAYRASKLLRKLRSEVELFNETKLELIKANNGVERDGSWFVEGDDVKKFQDELKQIVGEEICLSDVAKIQMNDLSEVDIEPAVLAMMFPILEDGPSKE